MSGHTFTHRFSGVFRSILSKRLGADGRKSRSRRMAWQDGAGCEALERRVVLTAGAADGLLASLTYVGVVTSPTEAPAGHFFPLLPFSTEKQSSQLSQLNTDVKALMTELQTLAAKSGVTISDLESLTMDGQSIGQAPFQLNVQKLNPVISELANAVAAGGSTSTAQTAFAALFSGSPVSSAVITKTFNDLVTAIGDSHVTTADLATVAADEAAIQTDLSNLPGRFHPDVASPSDIEAELTTGVIDPIVVASPPIVPGPPIVVNPPIIFNPPIIIGPIPIGPGSLQGGSLLASLNFTGVVTSPVVVVGSFTTTGTTPASQLRTDLQALQTELQSLATTSGLTVADLESLAVDEQSIAQAGFHFDPSTLNPVISELATAVAGGASTSSAQTAFAALFTGSKVTTAEITSTFNDLVTAITDSQITTADLTTVASDEAAIKTDLGNLHSGSGGSGTGSSGTGGSGTTGTGTGTTGTGQTGTGTKGSGGTGTSGTVTTGTGSTGTGTSGTGSTSTGSTGHKKGVAPHGHRHIAVPVIIANAHERSKAHSDVKKR